jgi:hypothetical protein
MMHIRGTVDLGITWLKGSLALAPDGSFRGAEKDLAAYYKSLLAIAVTGRLEAGARCLSYVRRHFPQDVDRSRDRPWKEVSRQQDRDGDIAFLIVYTPTGA